MPRKTKIGTEVSHLTRDSDTTFKVKRSRSPDRFGWLFIIYMDATILYATAQSELLPVDNEYSWNKPRWGPQA